MTADPVSTPALHVVANRMTSMPDRLTMGDVARVRAAAAEIERLRAASSEPAWPRHAGGLYITHNEHLAYYETVERALETGTYLRRVFPDEAELAACIASNSVWEIHWYPETPGGFCRVYAATFTRALELANAE